MEMVEEEVEMIKELLTDYKLRKKALRMIRAFQQNLDFIDDKGGWPICLYCLENISQFILNDEVPICYDCKETLNGKS